MKDKSNVDSMLLKKITSFVLPTGMTINMNGTTMMHMFAVTFIATAAGINVTPGNMIVMALLPLNVIGDAAVNVIVNASEGELDKEVYNSYYPL